MCLNWKSFIFSDYVTKLAFEHFKRAVCLSFDFKDYFS